MGWWAMMTFYPCYVVYTVDNYGGHYDSMVPCSFTIDDDVYFIHATAYEDYWLNGCINEYSLDVIAWDNESQVLTITKTPFTVDSLPY